jgi:hypothetical protein
MEPGERVRGFEELRNSGLLWRINASVFHPQGYALALVMLDGRAVGWQLLGDGSEPWEYASDSDEQFAAVKLEMK